MRAALGGSSTIGFEPAGSTCATFASVVLKVDNERWKGVPFLFTAGKGMEERVCEIRVRYKKSSSIMGECETANELVMRVQVRVSTGPRPCP